MSDRRLWPVWLIFAGVFLAGGVTGGFVSLRVAKTVLQDGRGQDQFTPKMIERLSEGLELTEAQLAAIKPIVDSTWEDLRRTRRESVEVMRAMEKAIAKILTPEQIEIYDEMQARHREHWNKMTERRGPRKRERGDGADGGPTPPPPPPDSSQP